MESERRAIDPIDGNGVSNRTEGLRNANYSVQSLFKASPPLGKVAKSQKKGYASKASLFSLGSQDDDDAAQNNMRDDFMGTNSNSRQEFALEQIRRAAANVTTKILCGHPYNDLDASRRLPMTEENVAAILYLSKSRPDLNLRESTFQSLKSIQRVARHISEREKVLDTHEYDTSRRLADTKRIKDLISHRDIQDSRYPLTQDFCNDLTPLNMETLDDELQLNRVDMTVPNEAYRDAMHWLRLAQRTARELIDNINQTSTSASVSYKSPDAFNLIKAIPRPGDLLRDRKTYDSRFWIHFMNTSWIPLVISQTGARESLDWRNLTVEWTKDLMPHLYLLHELPHFAKLTHYLFSALLETRVPGFLRLIVRLNGFHMFETRLNMIESIGAEGHSIDVAVNSIVNIAETARHNLSSLKILWPFVFEHPDIDVENLVLDFLKSPLCHKMINLLKLPTLKTQQATHALLEFLRLIADMIISSHSPAITSFLIHATDVPDEKQQHSTADTLSKKKSNKSSNATRLTPYFSQLKNYIEIENFNIVIIRDVLIMMSDIIYLSAVHRIPLIKFEVVSFLNHLIKLGERCKNSETKFMHSKIWRDVILHCDQLSHILTNLLEDGLIETEELYKLTTCFQVYKRASSWPFNLSPKYSQSVVRRSWNTNELSSLPINRFLVARGGGHEIPCWRVGCQKILKAGEIQPEDQHFFYCQRCYIASYCSKYCSVRDWNIQHRHNCQQFARPSAFLRFFLLDEISIESLPPIGQRLCEVFEKYTSIIEPWDTRPFFPIF